MARTKSGVVYHRPAEVSYRSSGDYFTIKGVRDRGEIATYDVLREMYPARKFNDFCSQSASDEDAGLPHGASLPLFTSIMISGMRGSGANKEKFRNFLYDSLRKWPWLQTAFDYNPEGQLDRIVHNVGSANQYIVEGNFTGKDFYVKDAGNEEKRFLNAALETRGTKTLDQIAHEVNGRDAYIWRPNQSPNQTLRKGAALNSIWFDDRFGFDAYRGLRSGYPSFRVLRVE